MKTDEMERLKNLLQSLKILVDEENIQNPNALSSKKARGGGSGRVHRSLKSNSPDT